MNITNLNEQELLDLQTKIEGRLQEMKISKLNEIDRLNNSRSKTKLSQLTSGDVILGIRFSWDHTNMAGEYLQTLGTRWVVDLVDYCDIKGYEDKRYRSDGGSSDLNRICILHKTESFGVAISLTDEEVDKPYLLHIDASSNGYCGFFTLSPKSWEVDIKLALDNLLNARKHQFDIDDIKLKEKVELVLKNNTKINNTIDRLKNKLNWR